MIEEHDRKEDTSETAQQRLSRRRLIKRSGAVVAAGGAGAVIAGCTPDESKSPSLPVGAESSPISLATPVASEERPPEPLAYFRPKEAAIIDAMTARIMPGDPDDPGAREAGVLFYIDRLLASGDGFAEPTYRQPPFASTYSGDEPPDNGVPSGFSTIWVHEDEIDRYGFQSMLTPRESYRAGIAALDRFAQSEYGSGFADLSEEDQNEIIQALVDDEAEGFDEPSAADFFAMVRQHTLEGMFADPRYGGNRGLVGWRMLDYPGAQRAYTPRDMKTEGHRRPPQALDDLPHFAPGRHDDHENVLLPVSGSEKER
jgi:gluconate 2-dehydrogenase gamma chain